LFIYKHGYDSKHTTPPLCLQTAGVRPIASQRFGDIVV